MEKQPCEYAGGTCYEMPDVGCDYHGEEALKNKTGYYAVKSMPNKEPSMIQSISEEFDEKFDIGPIFLKENGVRSKAVYGPEEIKSFIQSKISQALTAERKELRAKIEGMALEQPAQAGQFALHTDGYNQAIEEVLSLLEEK